MSVFLQTLGVTRRLNAAGTLTRLGGALMAPEVLQAMQEAAAWSVDMAELQTAASQRIAAFTGAEAGLVTTGASAGLTLATAACLAGWDAARMAALPDTRGMPARVLMHRTHRNTYDHAVRLAGGCIVDIGHNDRGTGAGVRSLEPWEIESALDAQTAAFVFVASPEALPLLPTVLEVMHRHGLPVVVDAAAQLPPRENLRRFVEMGADLVVFSGGKALQGPQSTGLLIGRRDLIGSALLQMMDMDVHPQTWAPAGLVDPARLRGTPLHGIGRGFKAGKEEIAGLLCALQRFVERDEAAQVAQWTQRLQAMSQAWETQASVLAPQLCPASPASPVPLIALRTPEPPSHFSRRLQAMSPAVHLAEGRMDEGLLLVNPMALAPADDPLVVQQIALAAQQVLNKKASP
jgi:D-glucosaminate-6-phosphate ammonia-lyase